MEQMTHILENKEVHKTHRVSSKPGKSTAWLVCLRFVGWALVSLMTTSGCEGNGHLRIVLQLPQAESLQPDLKRASQIQLSAVRPDGTRESVQKVWKDTQQPLYIGKIEPGRVDYLELVGFAADGHVLAYGRTSVGMIPEAQDGEVTMALRKPITYVAGSGFILTIDTSEFDENQVLDPIPIGTQPTGGDTQAVATTPDGTYLLAGGTAPVAQFAAVPTSGSNDPNATVRSLNWRDGFYLTDLAVSPDARWLLVAGTTSTGGAIYKFSLANVLHAPTDPNGINPAGITTGKPTKILFTSLPDQTLAAVVLIDSLDPKEENCPASPPASSYYFLPLDSPAFQPHEIPLGGAASDIQTTMNPPMLYVVYPCGTTSGDPAGLAGLDPTSGDLAYPIIPIPGARSLARTSDFLIVGRVATSQAGAYIELILQDIHGPWNAPEQRQIEVPPLDVRIGEPNGATILYLSIPPTSIVPYMMQGAPAGDRISLLLQGTFVSSPLSVGGLQIPQITVHGYFYATVDIEAEVIGTMILTQNEITQDGSQPYTVTSIGGLSELGLEEFQPTDLAHIYEVP